MYALDLSGTIFSSVSLWIMVQKNAKDIIWHLKISKGPETNAMKIE